MERMGRPVMRRQEPIRKDPFPPPHRALQRNHLQRRFPSHGQVATAVRSGSTKFDGTTAESLKACAPSSRRQRTAVEVTSIASNLIHLGRCVFLVAAKAAMTGSLCAIFIAVPSAMLLTRFARAASILRSGTTGAPDLTPLVQDKLQSLRFSFVSSGEVDTLASLEPTLWVALPQVFSFKCVAILGIACTFGVFFHFLLHFALAAFGVRTLASIAARFSFCARASLTTGHLAFAKSRRTYFKAFVCFAAVAWFAAIRRDIPTLAPHAGLVALYANAGFLTAIAACCFAILRHHRDSLEQLLTSIKSYSHCCRCCYDLAGISTEVACPECGHQRITVHLPQRKHIHYVRWFVITTTVVVASVSASEMAPDRWFRWVLLLSQYHDPQERLRIVLSARNVYRLDWHNQTAYIRILPARKDHNVPIVIWSCDWRNHQKTVDQQCSCHFVAIERGSSDTELYRTSCKDCIISIETLPQDARMLSVLRTNRSLLSVLARPAGGLEDLPCEGTKAGGSKTLDLSLPIYY